MTLAPERAVLVQQIALENGYFAARLAAPIAAARARPGYRITLAMRSGVATGPLFVMRADAAAGWIEVLYATDVPERAAFSQQPRASTMEVMLDESRAWNVPTASGHTLIVADGSHLGPAVFLADTLRQHGLPHRSLILLEVGNEPPFRPRPSHILVNGMPAGVIAAMPLLEDWSVASRLASRVARPGCFEGRVGDLAQHWLSNLDPVPSDLVVATAGIEPDCVAQLTRQVAHVCSMTPH